MQHQVTLLRIVRSFEIFIAELPFLQYASRTVVDTVLLVLVAMAIRDAIRHITTSKQQRQNSLCLFGMVREPFLLLLQEFFG